MASNLARLDQSMDHTVVHSSGKGYSRLSLKNLIFEITKIVTRGIAPDLGFGFQFITSFCVFEHSFCHLFSVLLLLLVMFFLFIFLPRCTLGSFELQIVLV